MIEVVENPTFKPEDFDPSKKKLGISAIIRLKNEADYLEKALNSILPFFDEFVIVYNQCTDRTPEIIEEFANNDPQRVRAFHYLPQVFPPASAGQRTLPANHVSSFVHYSNFALSKASYRVCSKWDGDQIAAPNALGRVIDRLRALKPGTLSWWLSPWKMGYWWFSGVNLWDRDGQVFVVKPLPTSGRRKDIGFWPLGRRHIFRHHPRVEYLRTWWFKCSFVGFVYYHVKGMKKDRGIGIYQLEVDPNSSYSKRLKQVWTNPELITFEEYCQIEPAACSLPDPESLGIRPVRGQTGD
jgi:glycosyltransferase involved in cell wall biosynthesis